MLGQATVPADPFEQCWSTYKVGAWVTLTSKETRSGVLTHTEMTNYVQAVTDQSVTIKSVFSTTQSAVKSGLSRKLPQESTTVQTPSQASQVGFQRLPDEDVTAMRRVFHTQVFLNTIAGNAKYYMSTEVPGCTVRMQLPSVPGQEPRVMQVSAFAWQ